VTFAPGDRVHVAMIGTGSVREVRNAGRYVVEVKGRAMVVSAAQLSRADERRRRARPRSGEPPRTAALHEEPASAAPSLDLHGRTVAEAIDALDTFLNDAMLGGHASVQVIHGRSGGRVKAAVHARLANLPSVRGFRLDPRNPGAAIVKL
jgi:dsDNA-specific endonuclease/ATPase MutS2